MCLFLDDLHTGKHLPMDDDLLALWCTCEYDLNECIQSGTIPFTDPQSGGKNIGIVFVEIFKIFNLYHALIVML